MIGRSMFVSLLLGAAGGTCLAGGGGMPSYDHEAMDRCRAGGEFRLYEAERDVNDALRALDEGQDGQREQRKITAESGVRNLSEEYALGSQVVGARAMLKDAWKRYRAAGGKVKTARDVPMPDRDPCMPKLP